MSAEIKLQAGQWYRNRGGQIVYCFGESKAITTDDCWIIEDSAAGHSLHYPDGHYIDGTEYKCDIIEHLPDCDSFDWVPPKPVVAPEGYRLLTHREKIEQDDLWWDKIEWRSLLGGRSIAGESWDANEHCPVARKIEPPQPKYRAFKDGHEFKPYRDEWFCYLNNPQFRTKVTAYDHRYVWFAGANVGESYLDAFKTRLREDGLPFGVLDDGT